MIKEMSKMSVKKGVSSKIGRGNGSIGELDRSF